ncbi:MAG: M48 family metallopeptidase [Candidatus Pacebacteria bacterium]|nr:M48 family metallopeptidase [Candidatus Paceibacterota bacterium]
MSVYSSVENNVRKTYLLMGCFLIFIILLGFAFSQYFQNPFILYFAVGFSIIYNLIAYYFSDRIALRINKARKANPNNSEDLQIIRIVENLCIASGLPMPKVYIIEDDALNAFATGRDPKNASVAFTRGLIKSLDKVELEGVAAHELAHIKNRDILVMTIVVALVGVIAIISDIFIRMVFFNGSGRDNKIILILAIVLAIISPIIAQIIKLAVSRKREYLADASAALMTRYPDGLAGALEKIKNGAKLKKVNTATAHMFIACPFGEKQDEKKNIRKGQKKGFFSKLFSTHPPIDERISILRDMNKK